MAAFVDDLVVDQDAARVIDSRPATILKVVVATYPVSITTIFVTIRPELTS